MRYLTTAVFVLLAGPAAADPGHLAEVAGHSHWVAGAAIGLAIALGLGGILKGKSKTEDKAEPEGQEDPQEA
ncbi:MAG: hypothetical protein KUG69_10745 [Marinosulfonomonas sp.]|nr:hypothetical protein [Marinosulfonomonas sp.]